MRGSIRQRSKGSYRITLEFGYQLDPNTGTRKRVQKFITFRGTKRQANDHLTDLLKAAKDGQYVDASKVTLGEWLAEWLKGVKARSRPATFTRYQGIVGNQIAKATIAAMPLQQIRASHIETYYDNAKVSRATLTLHHTILQQAFKKAVRDRLVAVNVVGDVETKPRRRRDKGADARVHCWTADEAQRFLVEAQKRGQQTAAFFALALDSGARKGELCGLRWSDLDLDRGQMRIVQQLLKPGPEPVFGPPKTGRPRTISLAGETTRLLAAHKRHQAEVKLKNRRAYHDFGLVFAKDYADLERPGEMLGHPLQINNLGQRDFAKIIKQTELRPIKFHGLRHTCASLLLQAGQPIHVVSERLGHSQVTMTLEVYAHVLPNMQQAAADRLNAILYGR